MNNQILKMLYEYKVRLSKTDNIDTVKEKIRMESFFMYNILVNYKDVSIDKTSEVKHVIINILYNLYYSYIELNLKTIDRNFLYRLESNCSDSDRVRDELYGYFVETTDSLLNGRIKADDASCLKEIDKITNLCIDIITNSTAEKVLNKKNITSRERKVQKVALIILSKRINDVFKRLLSTEELKDYCRRRKIIKYLVNNDSELTSIFLNFSNRNTEYWHFERIVNRLIYKHKKFVNIHLMDKEIVNDGIELCFNMLGRVDALEEYTSLKDFKKKLKKG